VHISDLTYDRVGFGEKAVHKFVQEGQKVSVRILKLDWENNRISLGLKQTMSEPFATGRQRHYGRRRGHRQDHKILEFGAFVELCLASKARAISELDHRRVAKVDDVVKPDEIVRVRS